MYKDSVKLEEARLRILTEASQQITSILDINELLERVVRLIQQAFGYYHVGIGLVEGDEVVYRVGAGILWDDPTFQFKPARLKIGEEGIAGWVVHTGQAALIPDVTRDARYVWMRGSATRSELTVPIIVKGRAIGVLDVQSIEWNDFDEADLNFMQMLANQAGVAIENARLFAETQRLLKQAERRANRLAIINSVQQMLASKFDVTSIYEQVGEKFRDVFDAQVVMISTYDALTDTVEHRYAIERGVRIPLPGARPPGGFRSQIIQTRQPVLYNVNVAEVAASMNQPTMPGTDTPKSWLGAPILVGEQVIGILSVQNLDRENAFDEWDVRLLQMFAASMSVALENARLFSQTERRAEQFRVLAEVSQHIISLTSVEELVEKVARTVKETFGYLHVGMGLVEGNFVVSKAEAGEFQEDFRKARIPMGQETWGWVAQHGQVLNTNTNMPNDAKMGVLCHLCVPLKIKNLVIGVISVESNRRDAFDESDKITLQLVANQASVAIENVRLYEQARHLAVLEERQRLARELHDSVTQSLYGINLYAEAAVGQLNVGQSDQLRQSLSDIQATAQESLADMRLMIYELRPPLLEREGLAAAIQNRLYSVENRAGLKSTFTSNLERRLLPDIEEGLYGIVREALNNTLKHANARNVAISLTEAEGMIRMQISDDGVGFDPVEACREGCLGIASMRERALAHGWQFEVDSGPGRGARVCVEMKR